MISPARIETNMSGPSLPSRRGEKSSLTFTYPIGPSLYVNVTNRCNADCIFCDRKGAATVHGYSLKMARGEEPEAGVYIQEIGDPRQYSGIVFCGYGEPTIRWEVVKQVARHVKQQGGFTRMNTNGHGNVINHRDITPELAGVIDTVSISLNSTEAGQYAALMRVAPSLHAEMLQFARQVKAFTRVVMSVVGIPSVDVAAARQFVTDEIGVTFREREYLGAESDVPSGPF
jgi:TatD DNase family protein